jgi:hypothetical protein
VQTRCAAAKASLDNGAGQGNKGSRQLNRKEIRGVVEGFGGLTTLLCQADTRYKADFYRRLGLRLTYNHEKRMVPTESRPAPSVCVNVVPEGGS